MAAILSIMAVLSVAAQTVSASPLKHTARDCTQFNSGETLTEIGIYSDANCQNSLDDYIIYGSDATAGCYDSGDYACGPFDNSIQSSVVYLKPSAGFISGSQVAVTRTQTCPPGGAAAVVVTEDGGGECLQVSGLVPGQWGITVYPVGGSGLAKRDNSTARSNMKRDNTCSTFTQTSSEDSYTDSVQISSIVSCIGDASPCPITRSVQDTKTISSTISINDGFSVLGFSFGATFSTTYSESEATTESDGFTVPVDQDGYLSTYSQSTLFSGTWSDCSDGSTHDGQVNAIKSGTQTFAVVITN